MKKSKQNTDKVRSEVSSLRALDRKKLQEFQGGGGGSEGVGTLPQKTLISHELSL